METERIMNNPAPIAIRAILVSVFIVWVAAVQSANASQQQESEVNRNAKSEIETARPPIDIKAPAFVKTASFGLG